MKLTFCVAGLIMLLASPVLCWGYFERPYIWLSSLIVGELFAFIGVVLIISELLCK